MQRAKTSRCTKKSGNTSMRRCCRQPPPHQSTLVANRHLETLLANRRLEALLAASTIAAFSSSARPPPSRDSALPLLLHASRFCCPTSWKSITTNGRLLTGTSLIVGDGLRPISVTLFYSCASAAES